MPPAANTARPRKAPTTAIHPGSDSDSDGYLSRLREAEAARGRLKKAKQTRDAKRKALAAAYQHHLAAIQDRVHKSVTLYQDLHSLMHMRRMKRIKEATDARDEKLHAIAGKLMDLQQIMVNHGTQLRALYKGRREDIAALASDAGADASAASGSSKVAG